jgi:hypothetical protein
MSHIITFYLHVVTTTYVAPRSQPLHADQHSVTHYERMLKLHSGVPGIFFKFDIEPVRLTLIQRITTLAQFFNRSVPLPPFGVLSPSSSLFHRGVGVIGGIFVSAS